jgi:hypothetical protein
MEILKPILKPEDLVIPDVFENLDIDYAKEYVADAVSNMNVGAQEFASFYSNLEDYRFCIRLILINPNTEKGYLEFVRMFDGNYDMIKVDNSFFVRREDSEELPIEGCEELCIAVNIGDALHALVDLAHKGHILYTITVAEIF